MWNIIHWFLIKLYQLWVPSTEYEINTSSFTYYTQFSYPTKITFHIICHIYILHVTKRTRILLRHVKCAMRIWRTYKKGQTVTHWFQFIFKVKLYSSYEKTIGTKAPTTLKEKEWGCLYRIIFWALESHLILNNLTNMIAQYAEFTSKALITLFCTVYALN